MESRFVSLRAKILAYFTTLLVGIVGIIAFALPTVMNQYFLSAKKKDIEKTREIINEVLTGRNFLIETEAKNLLDVTARSSDICIWICVPEDAEKVSIFSFGSTTNSDENFGSLGGVELRASEINSIRKVLNGEGSGYSMNTFPSAFTGQTISLGYQQEYKTLMAGNGTTAFESSMETAAVFIHIAMDDISLTTRSMVRLVFFTLLLVCLASWGMVFFLTNNIIYPGRNLQKAAGAVMRGDFTQTVNVEHNDEIGQLTQSFNQMTRELKELDTLQSDFIANISHDFRSPLTSIKGYVEAMMDGTIPAEQFEKYLGIVLDETNRLTQMTNNVLDLTKMENGQIELHETIFDINETIVKLALSLEQRVEEKKIRMNFQFLQEKLYVNADEALIQRVVYNLMDNALKFTSEGDSITIETSIVARKALISVSDTGIGISEQSLPYVFERFHKGDRSRGKDKKGTGLGLAIAKQIITTHHEDIKVFSKVGEGTTFQFTLPLAYRHNLVEKK